jgi:hypothetical protein
MVYIYDIVQLPLLQNNMFWSLWHWTDFAAVHTVLYSAPRHGRRNTWNAHRCMYTQEAKYVESWPRTTSAWASWSRFDIPINWYGGVHSLLICTSSPLWFPTGHRASQQDNTYWTKYQEVDRASTLVTLWCILSLPGTQSLTTIQYSWEGPP